MKILTLLSLVSAGTLALSPLAAQEAASAAPAATESAATETAAPSTTAPESVAPAAAASAASKASRPLPKVREGTPYIADRGRLITFSILFFLLSVFMAGVLLRSKEDIPA